MITMISLLAVLLLVVGGINGLNIYQTNGKSNILLDMLVQNGGSFPKQWDKGSHPPEPGEETRPKDGEDKSEEPLSPGEPPASQEGDGIRGRGGLLATGCQRRRLLRPGTFP